MLINEGGADFSMIKETDLLFKTLNPGVEVSRDLGRQSKKVEPKTAADVASGKTAGGDGGGGKPQGATFCP